MSWEPLYSSVIKVYKKRRVIVIDVVVVDVDVGVSHDKKDHLHLRFAAILHWK